MPMQYTEILKVVKKRKFSVVNFDIFLYIYIFLIFAQNKDCGYTLEQPHRGGSNEYQNLCFGAKKKEETIGISLQTRIN